MPRMYSRFSGFCRYCREEIDEGEEIFFLPQAIGGSPRGAYHLDCADPVWLRFERSYRKTTASPPPSSAQGATAFQRLYLLPSAPPDVVKAAYRALAKIAHPDYGGTKEAMQAINAAYAEALKIAEARAA